MSTLGLMTAMPEELNALLPTVDGAVVVESAGRRFHRGRLWGREVVAVFSRWGKTAAASTATEMILRFRVGRLVFSGIAGALDPGLRPGDIVVARRLVHHDLDASPFFPPGVVPLLDVRELPTDEELSTDLLDAADRFLREDAVQAAGPVLSARLDLASRRALRADVGSGDRVIASHADQEAVRSRVPSAACVEMEGAAVAQVCYEHRARFACVRTISDSADHVVAEAVRPFFTGLAGVYTAGVLKRWLTSAEAPASRS
jgi:adenosylhomocysteine nucleosidase